MNPGRGIALKIASTFIFTLMLVCVKAVADTVPVGQVVFSRSFFALIPIVVMLVWQGRLSQSLRTSRPWTHASRGLSGISAMWLNFAALALLPLPETMAIGYAQPLIVVALAAIILGEQVRAFRWSAVCIGFIGIVIILWPRFTLVGVDKVDDAAFFGAVLALLAAASSGLTAILVRSMTRTEPTGTIVLYFTISASLLSLLSLPFGWVVPTPREGLLLVLTGLLGGVAQIVLTSAYRSADAGTVASFEYTSMLWGIAFAYVFFREVPTGSVISGGAIVIAAGIFIIYRERQLGILRKRQRKTTPPS